MIGQIRLQKLILRDFQGGSFTLDCQCEDVDVFGDNGTGKTRIVSAFSWLLFDKDSLGRADFEIKNLDTQGEAAHGLEHSVEGVLEDSDGVVTLKKVFKEIWTKKRGSAQATFSGHTTEYFIDGVPVQKKEYTQRVNGIAGDETIFRLLTSPTAFPALHWQKQRGLLLEVCGDMTDAEVIASDSRLEPLSFILYRKIDDHRKIITAKKTEINKELEKIPVRIDEVRRGLPDVSGIDSAALQAEIALHESTLNDAKLKLQGINTGGKIAELSKQLAGVNADIQKTESQHNADTQKALNKVQTELSAAVIKADTDRRTVAALDNDIRRNQRQIETIEDELIKMRSKWQDIDAQEFQDTIESVCPACNQDLPSDRVQDARDNAMAAFNLKKAEGLSRIEREGKTLSRDKDNLNEEINKTLDKMNTISESLAITSSDIERLTAGRDAIKNIATPVDADLLNKKMELETSIKEERAGKLQDTGAIRADIQRVETLLKEAKEKASYFTIRESGEKRISYLKAEEKRLSAEYEKLEAENYLIEQFIRTKVNLLTARINNKFEVVRFKLFETLVNGAISECCEITVNGIPFSGGLNSGARMNAGVDIIRTLQRHYGIHPVVFVDNAESVVKLLPMECQVVRLIVSASDKTLRVENKTRG